MTNIIHKADGMTVNYLQMIPNVFVLWVSFQKLFNLVFTKFWVFVVIDKICESLWWQIHTGEICNKMQQNNVNTGEICNKMQQNMGNLPLTIYTLKVPMQQNNVNTGEICNKMQQNNVNTGEICRKMQQNNVNTGEICSKMQQNNVNTGEICSTIS